MLSIVLLLVSVFGGQLFEPETVLYYTKDFGSTSFQTVVEFVALAIYSYFLASLFVTLMHGVYFISERAHKSD